MSSIFISHSSRDNKVADELKMRLAERGYRSVFLDFDPSDGIPAGRDWEKELYARLRGCHAMIVLCSKHSLASRWCFAELTHAKALGKPIFPIRIDDAPVEDLLTDRQVIDAVTGWDDACARLWNGLRSAGLDPDAPTFRDPDRPPYPGLLAFQEEDAAVFFGRDAEIRRGMDLLNRLHRFGGARLVLVLGASGSGKSSLLRAGLLPRLRRNPQMWLPLDAFRPMDHPFTELARALAGALRRTATAVGWRELHQRLVLGTAGAEERAARFLEILKDLRDAAGAAESTVLVSVDQCEELLTRGAVEETEQFVAFISAILRASDGRVLLLGTLRSDFLGTWQELPPLRAIAFESLPVGPMARESLPQVIEGPARVAGVELEPGLVPAMVGDTGTAPDGLPLLAYALRELWERDGEDRHLGLNAYRDGLGGLEGCVARAAEAILRGHVAETGRGSVSAGLVVLSDADEAGLRESFLSMVRVGEDGRFVRRSVAWSVLPGDVRGLLRRFVAARLLAPRSEGEEVEVAHEALFRAWHRLVRWLEENRDFLVWRRRLGEALAEWNRCNRHPAALLAGPALTEALDWVQAYQSRLTDVETEFVRASEAVACEAEMAREEGRRRELERARALADEQARRLEAEQRRAEEQTRAAGSLRHRLFTAVVFAVLALLASGAALRSRRTAMAERDRAVSLGLVSRSQGVSEARLDLSLLLAVAAVRFDENLEARGNLLTLLQRQPRISRILHNGGGRVTGLALSADRSRLAAVDDSGRVRLWEPQSGRALEDPLVGRENGWLTSLAFSPDGHRVAVADSTGRVRLWGTAGDDLRPLQELRPDGWGRRGNLVFSPDGSLLAIGSIRGWVRLQRVVTGPHVTGFVAGPVDSVDAGNRDGLEANGIPLIAFSPDGRWLATATSNAGIQLWDLATRRRIWTQGISDLTGLAFLAGGAQIAIAERGGAIRFLDSGTGRLREDVVRGAGASSLASTADGALFAVGNADGTIRLWNLAPELVLRAGASTFSADRRLLAAVLDTVIGLWDVRTGELRRTLHTGTGQVSALALGPDGTLVAAGTRSGAVRLWRLADGASPTELLTVVPGAGEVRAIVFSPRTKYLAASRREGRRGAIHLWSVAPFRLLGRMPTQGRTYAAGALAFSPDEELLAAGGRTNGTVHLWRMSNRTLVAELRGSGPVRAGDPSQTITVLEFSADGKRLIGGTFGRGVRAWEVTTPELSAKAPNEDPGGWVTSLALSPDGEMLAVATIGGIRLWHAADLRMIGPLRTADGRSARTLGFTPDGRELLSLSDSGGLTRSETALPGWIARACRVAGRDLDENEWRDYVSRDIPPKKVCTSSGI